MTRCTGSIMALYIRVMLYRFHYGTVHPCHVVSVPLWHKTSVTCCIGSITALDHTHVTTIPDSTTSHITEIPEDGTSRVIRYHGHKRGLNHTLAYSQLSRCQTCYDGFNRKGFTRYHGFKRKGFTRTLPRFQTEGLHTLPWFQTEGLHTLPWFQTEGVHTLPWFQSEVDLHVAMVSTGVGLHVAKRERFARYHGYQT